MSALNSGAAFSNEGTFRVHALGGNRDQPLPLSVQRLDIGDLENVNAAIAVKLNCLHYLAHLCSYNR